MKMSLFRRTNRNAGLVNSSVYAGELTIRIARASSQTTVTVTGRVTVDSSPQLRSALLGLVDRGAGSVVVVDMSALTYMDMSGLATLFEALKAARRSSVKLRVMGITGQTRRLAEVAELDRIFQAAGSEVEYR